MEVMAIVTAGIDLAKNDFAVHGVDELGNPVLVTKQEVPTKRLGGWLRMPPGKWMRSQA
jgi:hypothetical protein